MIEQGAQCDLGPSTTTTTSIGGSGLSDPAPTPAAVPTPTFTAPSAPPAAATSSGPQDGVDVGQFRRPCTGCGMHNPDHRGSDCTGYPVLEGIYQLPNFRPAREYGNPLPPTNAQLQYADHLARQIHKTMPVECRLHKYSCPRFIEWAKRLLKCRGTIHRRDLP